VPSVLANISQKGYQTLTLILAVFVCSVRGCLPFRDYTLQKLAMALRTDNNLSTFPNYSANLNTIELDSKSVACLAAESLMLEHSN